MGTFSNIKKKKPDPWFCVPCDPKTGELKAPFSVLHDPFPNVERADVLVIDEDPRMFIRAKSKKEAASKAKRQIAAYMETREEEAKKAAEAA